MMEQLGSKLRMPSELRQGHGTQILKRRQVLTQLELWVTSFSCAVPASAEQERWYV